jgi:hypothetical protein
VGVLEWIGAHLLAPFVNVYRALLLRPRPDPRIVGITPMGGLDSGEGQGFVDFLIELANYGTQQCRVKLTVLLGELVLGVSHADLIPNTPPQPRRLKVPRPRLGDLMKECNEATTLYGETLVVRLEVGRRRVEKRWREEIYDPIADRVRHEIQQRYWRRGRGEETEGDQRAERLREHIKRVEAQRERLEDV